jgi:tyrosine-protein phosphatase SIW14
MDAGSFQVQMVIRWLLACVVFFGIAGSACRYGPDVLRFTSLNNVRASDHPAVVAWAQPMQVAGLPNLFQVSDDLYRGAQPTPAGMQELQKLGVRTIINLREPDADTVGLQGTNLVCECIPMTAFHPKDDDVVRFLQIVTDAQRGPVFVHCKRGADRTGMMCAIYRVAVQGWTKEQALDEMTRGGFGFCAGYQNLVRYIRDLDIDAIRQRALSPEPPATGLSESGTAEDIVPPVVRMVA